MANSWQNFKNVKINAFVMPFFVICKMKSMVYGPVTVCVTLTKKLDMWSRDLWNLMFFGRKLQFQTL